MNERAVMALTSIGFGILSNKLFLIPAILLVLSNVIDYATALISLKIRGLPWDSSVGIKGIFKKVLMWLLVMVGAIFDMLIIYASEVVGIEAPFSFLIASIVSIWLICNELISILENIKACGVKLPPFLEPLIKATQEQIEEKADGKGK